MDCRGIHLPLFPGLRPIHKEPHSREFSGVILLSCGFGIDHENRLTKCSYGILRNPSFRLLIPWSPMPFRGPLQFANRLRFGRIAPAPRRGAPDGEPVAVNGVRPPRGAF